MKKCYVVNESTFWLTKIEASENLKHFLNLVNRAVYGKSGVRKKYRVNCLPALEDYNVRPHYHLCLDKPERMTMEQFTLIIHQSWSKTYFGFKEIDVKICDGGWIGYMTKYKTKENFADSIDWLNYHNSERAV